MPIQKKVCLIIMDGWGINPDPAVSAIAAARTPFVDSLYDRFTNTTLLTFGRYVGLPDGQMGNSEVGHMNIGAGRIVYQELQRINKAIADGDLQRNQVLLNAFKKAKQQGKPIHFIGLVSDGGIHSHISHLKALISISGDMGVKSYVHAFTDGRDTDPRSGVKFIRELQQHCSTHQAEVASIIGRYYAMDRDKRWARIKQAYELLVSGKGKKAADPVGALEESYAAGITDEFVQPLVLCNNDGHPKALIQPGDTVVCFNFRTDRCRQITEVLTQEDRPEDGMHTIPLDYITMTAYDNKFRDIAVVFEKDNIQDTLGEVISREGGTQLRIAETEKYPHVTFFFSGGRENNFQGEDRVMIPSPKVATYDLQPAMSAFLVRDAVLDKIKEKQPDFICLNFANADMVGHTGVFEAGIQAVETVDQCVEAVVKCALDHGYDLLITADHGNADMMINPDGSPNTAHTKNPVPLFFISKEHTGLLKTGKLGDLAPTILHLMDLPVPATMTGINLLD